MTNPYKREIYILVQPIDPNAKAKLVCIESGEEEEFLNGRMIIRHSDPPKVLHLKPHPEDDTAMVLDTVADLPEPNETVYKDKDQVITRRS